jgi:peptidoglycan hydrolase CwlO-like protein
MNKTIDRYQFRITVATAIIVMIFIITASVQLATWKAEIAAENNQCDSRISHIGEKVIDMRDDISNLEEQASDRDVELAKINTKLTSIEALLIEIKTDLKEGRS